VLVWQLVPAENISIDSAITEPLPSPQQIHASHIDKNEAVRQLHHMPSEKEANNIIENSTPKKARWMPSLFPSNISDKLYNVLLVRFLLGLASLVFLSDMSLLLEVQFGASSRDIGFVISYTGFINAVSCLSVGFIAKYYDDYWRLFLHINILMLVSILGMTFSSSLTSFSLYVGLFSFSTGVARVAQTNLLVLCGSGEDTGSLMGVGASVTSVARMLGPLLGGVALDVHVCGPGVVSALVAALSVYTILVSAKRKDKVQ